MGFVSVLNNISEYLDEGRKAGSITDLATVYPWAPDITPEGAFTVPGDGPTHKMGTVAYLHLMRNFRARGATGGDNSGIKKVSYNLTIFNFTRSAARESSVVGVSAQTYIDSLTEYIEANRIAGSRLSPNPIFQWGEGETLGANDLPVEMTLPRNIKQGVKQIFSSMSVTVLEYVYA